MKTLTVEQQIAALRPAAGFAAHMHRWFLLAAALGVVAAVVFRHPVPLMLSVFPAVVGLSEKRAGPNIVAAIAAYDSGTPTRGEAAVSITSWDADQHYRAVVREPGHPDWEFEFVPQGWRPAERSYPARIWRNGGGLQPVLAAVEAGIMIPRYDPQRAGSATADPGFVR